MTERAPECPVCGLRRLAESRFCAGCGAPLAAVCSACGRELRPQATFCDGCGQAIGEFAAPSTKAGEPPLGADAEWRQLTVMFCDLARSTQMVAKLGAEAWREVVRAFQASCAEVIEDFGGHIAQYLGDGLLVYFSYPQAHEDDAERAVRAGLAMLEAGEERLNPELKREHGVELAMRIGIHTGPVVLGEIGGGERRETLAVGQTANIAARLQGVAEPGSVVMSTATLRLVPGLFLTRELGPQTLKGVAEPIPTYRVVQATGVRSRLDVAKAAGLTPLVARQQEIGLLLDRWEQVQDGMGQAVFVCGEPGIGKSRLLLELRERLAETRHSWFECRATAYTQDSALYPVIELQQEALGFAGEDPPEAKLAKLERGLERRGFSLAETLPLFAALHSVPLPERYEEPNLTPQARRRKTLEALAEWLLRLGRQQPVLLLVEDLHWIDPSTLELLGRLLEQLPTAPVLAILTYRPVFHLPWEEQTYVTTLQLSRLTKKQSAQMVDSLGNGSLPETSVQEIVRKTDGVPLFLEEFTKAWLESPAGDESPEGIAPAVPERLQDLLMARLDRLGPAKEIAQLGATLGREFSYPLLQAVWPHEETALREGLSRLVREEFLHQRGLPPQASYLFKHALIQQEAYQSQLQSRKQRVHRCIAEVLEERFPEIAETQPELVARHYTEAGLTEPGIRYWQQAGERAVERSANAEAIRHLSKGLELLESLPEGSERLRGELALQIPFGTALLANRGYAARDVAHSFERVRKISREFGRPHEFFLAQTKLWGFHLLRADRRETCELAEQQLHLAQRLEDPAALLAAHLQMGMTVFWKGEYTRAQEHVVRALELYDPKQHRLHPYMYPGDTAMYARTYLGLSFWYLGYPGRAWRNVKQGLDWAETIGHPYNLAFALAQAATVRLLRKETHEGDQLARRLVDLSTEQEFPQVLGQGMAWRGWAALERGDFAEAIAGLQSGLGVWQATGANLVSSAFLGLLARALWRAGKFQQGLAAVEEGLNLSEKSLDRLVEPEGYRVRGELLIGLEPESQEAEKSFLRALEVARRQHAKSWELRAAMSLARLWQSQGKRKQARELLAPVYDWFTEGFDTQDLKDAKALLEELS